MVKNLKPKNLMSNKKFIDNLVEPAIDFIKTAKSSPHKTIIICDDDCDGISSSVLIAKCLKNFEIIPIVESRVSEDILKKISREKNKIRFIIFLDTADVRQDLARIKPATHAKILIIDHHVVKKYSDATYVNPRDEQSEAYMPTTCMAYSIYKKICKKNKKTMLWLAAVGVLGDHGVKGCMEIFEELKKENYELVENVRKRDVEFDDDTLVENSMLGMLTKIIDSGRIVKGVDGTEFVIKTLLRTTDYEKFLAGSTKQTERILGWYCAAKKELGRLLVDFEKNKKQVGSMLIYEFKSKLKIKSSFANSLPSKYDDKIIVILQQESDQYKISMRRGTNINVDLAQKIQAALSGIPGASGGGHPEAVGGRIPKQYLQQFLKNLA
jgi:single-stranded DNA-specific DHH superfamily exonuclease